MGGSRLPNAVLTNFQEWKEKREIYEAGTGNNG